MNPVASFEKYFSTIVRKQIIPLCKKTVCRWDPNFQIGKLWVWKFESQANV